MDSGPTTYEGACQLSLKVEHTETRPDLDNVWPDGEVGPTMWILAPAFYDWIDSFSFNFRSIRGRGATRVQDSYDDVVPVVKAWNILLDGVEYQVASIPIGDSMPRPHPIDADDMASYGFTWTQTYNPGPDAGRTVHSEDHLMPPTSPFGRDIRGPLIATFTVSRDNDDRGNSSEFGSASGGWVIAGAGVVEGFALNDESPTRLVSPVGRPRGWFGIEAVGGDDFGSAVMPWFGEIHTVNGVGGVVVAINEERRLSIRSYISIHPRELRVYGADTEVVIGDAVRLYAAVM